MTTTGTPALDHTIVWASDRARSAQFLAHVLGLPVGEPTGPFLPIRLGNDVSLDFAESAEKPMSQHYAFRIGEAEFDAALARITAAGITYWADPMHTRLGQLNDWNGGRGLYFADPDDHNMELLTAP